MSVRRCSPTGRRRLDRDTDRPALGLRRDAAPGSSCCPLHVRRVKNGTPATHPFRGDGLGAGQLCGSWTQDADVLAIDAASITRRGRLMTKSREMIEEFVKQNHAQLWIQHDYTAGIKRKIAPAFYD
jgi:hypothetical protein